MELQAETQKQEYHPMTTSELMTVIEGYEESWALLENTFKSIKRIPEEILNNAFFEFELREIYQIEYEEREDLLEQIKVALVVMSALYGMSTTVRLLEISSIYSVMGVVVSNNYLTSHDYGDDESVISTITTNVILAIAEGIYWRNTRVGAFEIYETLDLKCPEYPGIRSWLFANARPLQFLLH